MQSTTATIEKKEFGKSKNNQQVNAYTLKNDLGTRVTVLDYGLTIQKLITLDHENNPGDIVLGFETMEGYESDHPFFGCFVGRNANRIKNAQVVLDGSCVQLHANEGKNQLHGGDGFQKKIWDCVIKEDTDRTLLECTYLSPDGEDGFPGNLKTVVTFCLTTENTLEMTYTATTDKTTIVNLTRHDYFNLNSAGAQSIFEHEVQIKADGITETDSEGIPTGTILPVAATSYDFNTPSTIQQNLDTKKPVLLPVGYDNNYVLSKQKDVMNFAANIYEAKSQRTLEIFTTQPGIQFYTGVHTKDQHGKNGTIYQPYSGLCLETQHFPDAANHANFESTVLKKEDTYHHKLTYRFGVRK